MRGKGLQRSVEINVICVILCTPAAVFLIGEHSATLKVLISLFGVGSGVFALLACRRGRPDLGGWILLPCAVAIFVELIWFAGLVVSVMSHQVAWLMLGLDIVVFLLLALKSRQIGWGLLFATPTIWTAIHVVFAALSFLYLMAPTDKATCEALEDQPGVTWFSGSTDPFFAADVHILQGGQHIAASAKIWHDGFLAPLFSGHSDHKVVIMPISGSGQRAEKLNIAQLPWEKMPQFLLADSHGNLVSTIIDHGGKHALGIIRDPTGESPIFDEFAPLPEGILANGLVEHEGKWVAIDVRRDILWIDPTSLAVVDRWLPPEYTTIRGPEMMLDFDMEGGQILYISTFGSRVFALHLGNKRGRYSRALGGPGGGVDWVPERNALVVGDMLEYEIRLVDPQTLTFVENWEVSYSVRPVRAAPGLSMIVAGDYIHGGVHPYHVNTLEPLGDPVYVGGNLRRIAYNPVEGVFYTASKCGVFKIEPKEAFPQ